MTQTIGDEVLATRLHKRLSTPGIRRAPNGYRKIGEGCYRSAYLHRPTETIYKIGYDYSNRCEAESAAELREQDFSNLSFDLHIPLTTLYPMSHDTSVVAMEFAKGAKPTHCMTQTYSYNREYDCSCKLPGGMCFTDIHDEIESATGICDIHSGNVLVTPDLTFWLIDLGA